MVTTNSPASRGLFKLLFAIGQFAVVCMFLGGCILSLQEAQAQVPINERVGIVEKQAERTDQTVLTLVPRVDDLEKKYASLQGLGTAAGILLGLFTGGQLILQLRK
jgi:hypothetical protein